MRKADNHSPSANTADGKDQATGRQSIALATETTPSATQQPELLERARMQWQFGDWESLIQLDEAALVNHPDRAKLALLAASAHQQLSDHVTARRFIHLANVWGCDRKTLARLLISGVHNTLGRAAALAHDETHALEHFRSAVDGVSGDTKLACQARSVREVARLGLYGRAGRFIERQLGALAMLPQTLRPLSSPQQGSADQGILQRMQSLAVKCLAAEDIHVAVDAELGSPAMDPQSAFHFCIALSDECKRQKDSLMAVHYLNTSRQYLDEDNPAAMALLSKKMLALGQHAVALDLLVKQTVNDADLDTAGKSALSDSYAKARAEANEKIQHGHALVLAHLQEHLAIFKQQIGGRKPVLIEIGSTRENVPGQGSTRIIAD